MFPDEKRLLGELDEHTLGAFLGQVQKGESFGVNQVDSCELKLRHIIIFVIALVTPQLLPVIDKFPAGSYSLF